MHAPGNLTSTSLEDMRAKVTRHIAKNNFRNTAQVLIATDELEKTFQEDPTELQKIFHELLSKNTSPTARKLLGILESHPSKFLSIITSQSQYRLFILNITHDLSHHPQVSKLREALSKLEMDHLGQMSEKELDTYSESYIPTVQSPHSTPVTPGVNPGGN
jgi:hypothetical protein